MTQNSRLLLKILLPVGLILLALGVAGALISMRKKPKKKDPVEESYLVETITTEKVSQRLDIEAQGSVEAAQTASLTPQVQGRIKSIHPNLKPGGLVSKGDVLLKIESTDYALNLQERRAALEEAKARLLLEKGQQQIAKEEWRLFKKLRSSQDDPPQSQALALREPQLKIAQLAVKTAQTRVKRAGVDLGRTTVKAPFDGRIQSESAEVGQLANPQGTLITLVGTDQFFVRASVPKDLLSRIDVPGIRGATKGSQVTISQTMGTTKPVTRSGHVSSLLPQVDPVGRMAQILITVEDPLGRKNPELATAPLLLGSFVQVVFDGSQTRNLIRLPRLTLHDGDSVWVKDDNSRLEIRRVKIASRTREAIFVESGLKEGESVITTPLSTAVPGTKLRDIKEKKEGDKARASQDKKAAAKEAQATSETKEKR